MPGPDYKPQPPDPSESLNQFCAKLPTEEEADAQVEAQLRVMRLGDPFPPGHLGDWMVQLRRQNEDLAMLVRSLIWTLNKYSPDHSMTWKAKDYLKRHGLEGSLLRSESETD